jgi:hypothetical protein
LIQASALKIFRGGRSTLNLQGNRIRAELFQVLSAFEPAKKSEELIQAEALREFNHLIELRRMRLANVVLGLPPVLWWVVAFGALMSVVLIWLQDMEIHVHLILGGILASILGTVIFLIAMLDNPFRGGVGPDSIALVYETFDETGWKWYRRRRRASAVVSRLCAAVDALS